MTLLEAALAYAARDIPVFPVHGVVGGRCTCGQAPDWHAAKKRKPGKHPVTKHGLKNATVDEARIRAWWGREPNFNIGLRPGPQSGFWVLDEDGEAGLASIAALEAVNGRLPPTPTQTTGRGRHRLFAWPPDVEIRNSAGRIGEGVDVRGAGGYIVVAPSNHELGRAYAWAPGLSLVEVDIAPAPAWLLDLAKPREKAVAVAPARPRLVIEGRASRYGEGAIESACRRIEHARPGQRNDALWLGAISLGQLVAGGEIRERGYALEALYRAGQAMCAASGSAWTRREIDTLDRGFAVGEAEPRTAPEPRARQAARLDHPARPPANAATPAQQAQTVRTAREIWDSARPAGCWPVFNWLKARGLTPEGIPGALGQLRVHARAPMPGGPAAALVAPLRLAWGGPVNAVALLALDGQCERFGRIVGASERRAVQLTPFEDPAAPLLVTIDLQDAWALGAQSWSRGARVDVAIAPTLKAFAGGVLGDRFGRVSGDMPMADPEAPPWTIDARREVFIALRNDLRTPEVRMRKTGGGTKRVVLAGEAAARFYGGVIKQAWLRPDPGPGANAVRLLQPMAGGAGFNPVKREAV